MFHKRDVLTIIVWATATAGLALALFLPSGTQADEQQPQIDPTRPRLLVDGVDISLQYVDADGRAVDPSTLKAGDKPILQLVADNPTDHPATVEYKALIEQMDSFSAVSRCAPTPYDFWTKSGSVTVPAGQSTTVLLATDAPLPANRAINLALMSGKLVSGAVGVLYRDGNVEFQNNASVGSAAPATQPSAGSDDISQVTHGR